MTLSSEALGCSLQVWGIFFTYLSGPLLIAVQALLGEVWCFQRPTVNSDSTSTYQTGDLGVLCGRHKASVLLISKGLMAEDMRTVMLTYTQQTVSKAGKWGGEEDRKKKTHSLGYASSPSLLQSTLHPPTQHYIYRPQIGARLNLAHRDLAKKENRSSYTEPYSDLGLGLTRTMPGRGEQGSGVLWKTHTSQQASKLSLQSSAGPALGSRLIPCSAGGDR